MGISRFCEIPKERWEEGKSCFWISTLSTVPPFPQLFFIVLFAFLAACVDSVFAMGGWPGAAPAFVAVAAVWLPRATAGRPAASRFLRASIAGHCSGSPPCRLPIHRPPPCFGPAHIGFAALLGTIDSDAEPPNRCRSLARSPAGTLHPVPSRSASCGDSPPPEAAARANLRLCSARYSASRYSLAAS